MTRISLSKAWDETRSALARDARLYAAVALALLVLPMTILGTFAPETVLGGTPPGGAVSLFLLLVILLGLVARLAMATLAMRSIAVRDSIRHALRRTPAAVGAFLLFALPVVLLLVPFLQPVLASPQNPPPGPMLAVTAVMILTFVLGVRLVLLLVPAAAAEAGGPVALLKRSWALSRGNWWRLAAFLLIFFIGSYAAARALGFVVGSGLILLTGPVEPQSVSALLLAAVLAIVGAVFATIFSVMLARIYVQAVSPAHADVSAPSSGT